MSDVAKTAVDYFKRNKGIKKMKITKYELLELIKEEIAETNGIKQSAGAQIAREIEIAIKQAQMSKSYRLKGPGYKWFENIADLAEMGMKETAVAPRSEKLNEDALDDALQAFGKMLGYGAAGGALAAMTFVELIATSDGRDKIKDILLYLPDLSKAICEYKDMPGPLCSAANALSAPLKKLAGLIDLINKIPKLFETLLNLMTQGGQDFPDGGGVGGRGRGGTFPGEEYLRSINRPMPPSGVSMDEIRLSKQNLKSLVEAGIKKSDILALQEDYKIAIEESKIINEAIPPIVVSALLTLFASQSGRETLVKVLRITPNFIKQICDLPEKHAGSSSFKPVAMVAKYATKICNTSQDLGGLELLANAIESFDDKDALNIINIVESPTHDDPNKDLDLDVSEPGNE